MMRTFYYDLVWLVLVAGMWGVDIWRYAAGDEKRIVWVAAGPLLIAIVAAIARHDYIEATADDKDEDDDGGCS